MIWRDPPCRPAAPVADYTNSPRSTMSAICGVSRVGSKFCALIIRPVLDTIRLHTSSRPSTHAFSPTLNLADGTFRQRRVVVQ